MKFENYKTIHCKIKENKTILDIVKKRRRIQPEEFFFIYGRLWEAGTDYLIDGVGNIFTIELTDDLYMINCKKELLEVLKYNHERTETNLKLKSSGASGV